VNGTLPAKIRRYKVEEQDCILASVAADILGVHRKTITRRQQTGRYGRLIDEDLKRVMVPLDDLKPDLKPGVLLHIESEAEHALRG